MKNISEICQLQLVAIGFLRNIFPLLFVTVVQGHLRIFFHPTKHPTMTKMTKPVSTEPPCLSDSFWSRLNLEPRSLWKNFKV
jgi:hypothetical protein